jgi:hypothetical protein
MYATSDPEDQREHQLDIDSRKATLAPPSTAR